MWKDENRCRYNSAIVRDQCSADRIAIPSILCDRPQYPPTAPRASSAGDPHITARSLLAKVCLETAVKCLVLATTAVVRTGCAAPATVLNPRTGQTATCGEPNWGLNPWS